MSLRIRHALIACTVVPRHQPFIFNVALKMTSNVADSEDITQEVLRQLLANVAKVYRNWCQHMGCDLSVILPR